METKEWGNSSFCGAARAFGLAALVLYSRSSALQAPIVDLGNAQRCMWFQALKAGIALDGKGRIYARLQRSGFAAGSLGRCPRLLHPTFVC